MQSSQPLPTERDSLQPSPAPTKRARSLFWPGFALGFALLAIASCGSAGIALGLNELSLAEIQGNGVVWTPPPFTPVPTPQAVTESQAGGVEMGSTRFGTGDAVRNLTNSRVNVRMTPGYLSKAPNDVIGVLQPGAAVVILGENQLADNLVWWRVRAALGDGRAVEGWVAEATASGVQILGE